MDIKSSWYHVIICGLLLAGVGIASAGEIPKAVWRPGYFMYPSTVRLSEDGRYVTMLSPSGVNVVDLQTGLCAFTQTFQYRTPPFGHEQGATECIAAVSSSGNEMCVLDLLANRLQWYHVGDALPWNVQSVEDSTVTNIQFVADTVLVRRRNATLARGGVLSRR